MESEKNFFEDRRVLVTNARCIIDNQTFAMSGITSVVAHTEVPRRTGPLFTCLVGIIYFFAGSDAGRFFWGAIILGIGIVWWRSVKDTHYLLLRSASGETKLLKNTDLDYINGIVRALNEAIVYRN